MGGKVLEYPVSEDGLDLTPVCTVSVPELFVGSVILVDEKDLSFTEPVLLVLILAELLVETVDAVLLLLLD